MAAVHPTPQQRHSPPPVPERSDSSSSSDSNLVGLIEPPVGFRSIIFKADPAEHAAVDDDPETPPYSRSVSPDGFDTDFDDSRLPALSRVRSAPGLGGEVRQKPEDQKRRSIAVGEAIPVSLEKIPAEHGEKTRRYVLKVDDELRELLAAGARERERHGSARNGRPAPRRGRFSDLVFTQNFTAFDRRNPESGRSPFHGFFVLMW